MQDKQYFWINLLPNATNEKKLRKLAGGSTYLLIYFKMQLLAIKNDDKLIIELDAGKTFADFANKLFPKIQECVDDIEIALYFFNKFELMEVVEVYLNYATIKETIN